MRAKTIWLFGYCCSGKTTIAARVKELKSEVVHLDGDNVRSTICKDFGFSMIDRTNNIVRIAELCQLLNAQGVSVVASFVTPIHGQRVVLSDIIKNCELVYVKCPIEVCIERDVKGHYAKAIAGIIPNFTGISSNFDIPAEHSGMSVDSACRSIDDCVAEVMNLLS